MTRRLSKVTHLPRAQSNPSLQERMDTALVEMARAITHGSGLAEAHRAQLGILHALFRPKSSYLLGFVPERQQLQIACVRGRNDGRITAESPGEGPVGVAFSERRIVRDPARIIIPVPGAERPLGCLVLLEPKEELTDSRAHAFAAQVAASWEVARIKDESNRRAKDLQTAIAGLKSLEKNRETLLSNVSHDLKNPLTTVKAYLTMLEQGKLGELDERQLRAVRVSDRNADRLLRMVQDLLLLSRLHSGRMNLNQRPFGLKALATEEVRRMAPMAERARVEVVLGRSAEAFIRGDRQRISEALFNLLEHAIDQSDEGGVVKVEVSADGTQAVISVRDDGVGMEPEQLEHVFEPYHRVTPRSSRERGASLGLPLVSKIVHLHGGRVEAESQLGEGTCFRLFLPVFAAAVSSATLNKPPRSGEILLVEDDRDCREVLMELLEQEGYSVVAVDTVEEARAALSECPPAMVLLDLRLAREDGRSVLRHIRGTPKLADLAVYLISGDTEVAALSEGTGLDRIDGFFEKPLPLSKLLDTVSAVVRPSRSARR